MMVKIAVLDDYQNVALTMADWTALDGKADIAVFNEPLGDEDAVAGALADFEVVCLMRERTPFPRSLIMRLPKLRLIVTTGPRNAAIDVVAANERGVVVCGTQSAAHPTAELVFAHMLEFARKVGYEDARLKNGAAWQTTLGRDLNGRTLGVLGLGRLGKRVAGIGAAFGMDVVAWSQNLTESACAEVGVRYVDKQTLLRSADFLTIHLQLSERTKGLVGATELALMKPGAFLINTSRGPIVEERALIAALRGGQIAGAGLDVFDVEPLPLDHPYRRLGNAQLSPHLGYVTEDNYRLCYDQVVEDIAAWIDGKPKRVITA